jgi:hypothetical protein
MLYPDIYPAYLRRGFTYNGVMVAPRQTFSLWTVTIFFEGNHEKWIRKYEGGELFEILLYNQVGILMTHIENYSGDRLAVFLLENVFDFLSKWTNLIFYTLPPLKIVEKYFKSNPDDQEPLLTVSSFRLKV